MENLLSHLARRAVPALLFFLPAEHRRTLDRQLDPAFGIGEDEATRGSAAAGGGGA